jgi:SNF2 family DNA or RNA helicase
MPAHLTLTDEAIEVDLSNCRGSEFGDALAKVKEIPGRRYDGDRKLWLLPREASSAEMALNMLRPTHDSDLEQWVKESRVQAQQELTTPLPDDANLRVAWANERASHQPPILYVGDQEIPFEGLMQHQRPVVDLAARVRKLIIADDMGLGKTGAAISAVEEFVLRNPLPDGTERCGPKLVICPNSVKPSWYREVGMWLGEEATIIDGTTPKARRNQLEGAIQEDGWVVVNWEQLRVKKEKRKVQRRNGAVGSKTVVVLKEPLFEEADWLAIIGDEVHRAKNRKAQTTQGLWRVRADEGLMLAMSGTPLMNSPDELWAILKWLWPDEYTSYWRFYETYVEYHESYFGKVITGVKNPDALRFELKNRLVRRTQGEVLDLPGKVRIPVTVTLNPKQRKLYDEAEKQLWFEVEQAIKDGDESAERFARAAAGGESAATLYKLPNGAARTVRLRQIIESPALLGAEDDSAVLDACVEKILDSGDEQWAVFTEFAETPNLLVERLAKRGIKAAAYTGSVHPTQRGKLVDEYQRGELQVIVGTIKSMYQGVTLTAGNKQFWVSRDWVPDVNEQGEDRQNRIGQDSRVFIFIAQAQDTVATDKIEPTNKLKESIVRAVLKKDEIKEEAQHD